MASGKSGELKGRVMSIGAKRVSADGAQIALIEEYLRRQGSGGAGTGDATLKQQVRADQAVGKTTQQALDKVKMRSAEARAELIRGEWPSAAASRWILA